MTWPKWGLRCDLATGSLWGRRGRIAEPQNCSSRTTSTYIPFPAMDPLTTYLELTALDSHCSFLDSIGY
jgi:hypothetical protein